MPEAKRPENVKGSGVLAPENIHFTYSLSPNYAFDVPYACVVFLNAGRGSPDNRPGIEAHATYNSDRNVWYDIRVEPRFSSSDLASRLFHGGSIAVKTIYKTARELEEIRYLTSMIERMLEETGMKEQCKRHLAQAVEMNPEAKAETGPFSGLSGIGVLT